MFCLFSKRPVSEESLPPVSEELSEESLSWGTGPPRKGLRSSDNLFKGKKQTNWSKRVQNNLKQETEMNPLELYIYIRCIDIHRYVYTLGVAPRASPSNSDQPGLLPSLADPKQKPLLSTGILGEKTIYIYIYIA